MSNKTDVIYRNWGTFRELMKDNKYAVKYYGQKIKDGHDAVCVPLLDVFTKAEVKQIMTYVRPEQKMCFMNAYRLANLFQQRVKYVEGEVTILNGGIGIEHAWNLVDGEHDVDLTFEVALGEDVRKEAYVAIGEYDVDTIRRVAVDTRVYGGVYDYLYREKNDVKNKKRNGKK